MIAAHPEHQPPRPPRFNGADADRAYDTWRCSCGPAAFAAILGLTLDEARPHFGATFPGYTSPPLMLAALVSALGPAGPRWRVLPGSHAVAPSVSWPRYGLARIQFGGPWMEPGVPIAARYKHTHWVGAMTTERGSGVWDVNALGNGSGWCSLDDWSRTVVPWIVEGVKRSDGTWSITHAIEVQRAPGDRRRTGGS